MHKYVTRTRSTGTTAIVALVVLAAAMLAGAPNVGMWRTSLPVARRATAPASIERTNIAAARRQDDFIAMQTFRPSYPFWQHVFTLPDHSIAFGSATDGRLLVIFPASGDWNRQAVWADPALRRILEGQPLARRLGERREQVTLLLERAVGPVLHNATRGDALMPNALKYGRFLGEWGAIYERFGVPADIGLAQVILESGLSANRRSEANAIGFCQWLKRNWKRLNYFSPTPIEGLNQTTQAPYCAAYLSVLATKYGSFIPALSEHNAGGTNVGRTLINGEHLGASDVRARYFIGSALARELRALPGKEYENVYRSYGPRSHLYAEMVFGNTSIVRTLIASTPQVPIYAMRTSRAISLAEIMGRTGLSADEVRRFNPPVAERIPAQTTLYLPDHFSEFGRDVAFWRRPPSTAYVTVLNDFLRLDSGFERWDDPAFAHVLADFRRRFRETNTEEGAVMDTVLAYAMDQAYTSGRRTLLSEFRSSEPVHRLIDRGVLELEVMRNARLSLR